MISANGKQAIQESSVPSSTGHSSIGITQQTKQTRQYAQDLRVILEQLDALHQDRNQLVRRAHSLAAVDDVQPRIIKTSSSFERFAIVTPAMFEDILDEELVKFDKFLADLNELKHKQSELLNEIGV
jgi:programmed cell death 6-interacting protein